MMRSIFKEARGSVARLMSSEEYWSRHNVTNHADFRTAEESLSYFDWRNDQYIGYIDLLPVKGHDREAVLDFGCGPGHDLVGFLTYSRPARLVGADVSATSLREARARVELHGGGVEFVKLSEEESTLPFDDREFDYIHCSGVLMCVNDPVSLLQEFHRILKPGGNVRLMVYNYNSIWLHLYVAHTLRKSKREFASLSVRDAFLISTDGLECPVNNCWTASQFTELAEVANFRCRHLGNAISLIEMSVLGERFTAAQSMSLEPEHRKFLLSLTFDERAIPYHEGCVAGIDACYEFTRAESGTPSSDSSG